MTQNQISHYESLKKQDTANRKLIKKLQLDKQALKEQLILSGVSHRRELLREYNNFNNERIYGGELTDFEIDCFMDSRNSG
jgi:hypothetical protein